MTVHAPLNRSGVESLADRLVERFRVQPGTTTSALPSEYEPFLHLLFPEYVSAPLGDHHHQLWRWFWALKRGIRPIPLVCAWARGGAKSTSVELGVVSAGAFSRRTYCVYVSGTQQQADDHVQNIASMLESATVATHIPSLGTRSVGKYGNSRGWRRNRVRTQAGLTVDALGLDVAGRGLKLETQRPDLIVLDDIDDSADSIETVGKKIVALTQKILPAGSQDCAIVFVQNVVHYESVMARVLGLASSQADFLAEREVSGPLPALRGLQVERIPGTVRHRIVSGEPVWAGQSREICQRQVDDWGLRAFRAEAQHERTPPEGQAFPEWVSDVHVCDDFRIPDAWPRWRAVDYGYAAPYCCLWLTRAPDGMIYVYNEAYGSGLTAEQQAMQIKIMSMGQRYFATVGDPSMWAETREGKLFDPLYKQYARVGVHLTKATNNRISGWAKIHDLLAHGDGMPPRLKVLRRCGNLIRTIPLLVKDPHKPEDIRNEPYDEDHAIDALRYAVHAAHWIETQKRGKVSRIETARERRKPATLDGWITGGVWTREAPG